MDMNRTEANKTIKENMKGEVKEDIEFYTSQAWGYDELDALRSLDGTDQYFGRYKAEHTKLCRKIGMEQQVKKGDYVQEENRVLKIGDWYTIKSYYQFN